MCYNFSFLDCQAECKFNVTAGDAYYPDNTTNDIRTRCRATNPDCFNKDSDLQAYGRFYSYHGAVIKLQ